MWYVLTWHFSALHTKPSGAQCAGIGARLCLCVCYVLVHTYMRNRGLGWGCCAHSVSPVFPILTHSNHTICDPPVPQAKKKIEGERELLRKVYLVSWQHPNYKIVETPCIERIFLNYSERKFKFHFVLALSNGQNCLGEISKGQGELKCLL